MQAARVIGGFLLASAVAVGAQTNVARIRPVTLRDCITEALAHNLDVQMVQLTPRIARFDLGAAYGSEFDPLFTFDAKRDYWNVPPNIDPKKHNPDNAYQETLDTYGMGLSGRLTPGLSYDLSASSTADAAFTFFNNPDLPARFTNAYDAALEFKLRQSLLKDFWIDAGRMLIQVNKKNLKISEQTLRWQLMNTVLAVQQAYYDLIYADENVRVMQQALTLAEQLLAEDRQRVAVGSLPPLGEQLSASEVETARANLLTAQDQREVKRAALRFLLTDNLTEEPDETLMPTDVLAAVWENPTRAESLHQAFRLRPDLIQARLEVERQGIVLRYDYNQVFPTLDLVGSYGALAVDPQSRGNSLDSIRRFDYPIYGGGVVLKLPLSNAAARNRYKASQAVKTQALLRLKKVEQSVFTEVDTVLKSLDKMYQRVGATRQARVFAEKAVDAEQRKLENGASTSFIVLEYERNLAAARSAEILAMADYNKALAQLALDEGTVLEKNQIKLELR